MVGAEAAARFYFGKPPSQLSWAEAAFLAALPQRPSAYDPRRDPAAAVARQRWILGRLRSAGKISATVERAARDEKLRFTGAVSTDRSVSTALAPHFAEMLTSSLRAAAVPGGRIRTTLDAGLQADVAGIAAAYDGYRAVYGGKEGPSAQGLTGDQRFFLSFGQIWRSKARPEALRSSLLTNGHAPGEFRADTVRNVDAWYAAFGVPPAARLYLAPQARVRVW